MSGVLKIDWILLNYNWDYISELYYEGSFSCILLIVLSSLFQGFLYFFFLVIDTLSLMRELWEVQKNLFKFH